MARKQRSAARTIPVLQGLRIPLYQCQECETISKEQGESPLYECNNCGRKFTRDNSANDNHQCPDCNKFASKLADSACPECEQGEQEELAGIQCNYCEDVVVDDAYEDHLSNEHMEEVFQEFVHIVVRRDVEGLA